MAFVGMLFLGGFVGTIITYGMTSVTDWTDLKAILATLLGTAVSGAVFHFLEYLGGRKLGDGIFMYPIGLVLGMMWVFVKLAVQNINGDNPLLGWLHIAGVVLVSVMVAILLFSPQLRSLLPRSQPPST